MMWLVGIQTGLITIILGVIWSKLNRIENRQIKSDEKINDMDKRVFGIETMLHMKECCLLNESKKLKKIE